MLKNVLKAFFFVMAAALFFTGCSFVTEKSAEYNSNILTISASFNNGAERSVMPSELQPSNLYYYLVAKKYYTDEIILPSKNIEMFSKGSSFYSAYLSADDYKPAYYIFGLFAHNEEISSENLTYAYITQKAVLSSTIAADTRYSSTLKFTLTPFKIDSNGELKLKLFTQNWTFDFAKYSASYKLTSASGNVALSGDILTLPESRETLSSYQIDSNGNTLSCGTYSLSIVFTSNNDSSIQFTYSSTVFIFANRITDSTVFIPQIILYAPEKPTNFEVYYKKQSGYYSAQFIWNDNSNNENYFNFQIRDISSAYDETKFDGTVNDWTLTYEESCDFGLLVENELQYYESGTLLNVKSSDKGSLTLKLQYGTNADNSYSHRYIARIRAVNDGGVSDWTYLTFGGNQTLPENYSSFTGLSNFIYLEE